MTGGGVDCCVRRRRPRPRRRCLRRRHRCPRVIKRGGVVQRRKSGEARTTIVLASPLFRRAELSLLQVGMQE